jgi:phage recombination protein Bet
MNAAAQNQGEIIAFQRPRLPWHDAIEKSFGDIGVTKSAWKALTEAVYPLAKTPDAIVMALSYCKARKLDPFKRPVHIVPMWDSAKREYVETIWPGISELRTTAFRTGQYAGCDETEFGPMVEREFVGMVGKRGQEKEKRITLSFPEWARITVHRELGGRVCKFVGPKVYWLESYASLGQSDVPNEMWAERPIGQIEKCAEAGALRRAFPEELGNMLSAEEMEGRRLGPGGVSTEHSEALTAVRQSREPPPAPRVIEHQTTHVHGIAEAERPASTSTETAGEPLPAQDAGANPAMTAPRSGEASASDLSTELDDSIFDGDAMLAEAREDFAAAQTARDVVDVIEKYEQDAVDRLSRSQQETWNHLCETAMARVNPPQKPVQAHEPPPAPTQPEEPPQAPRTFYEAMAADPFAIPQRGAITTEEAYAAYIGAAIEAATDADSAARLKALWKGTQKHRAEDIGLPVAASNALRKRVEAKLDELERKP